MSQQPIILSIQVGRPARHGVSHAADPLDRPWTTALFKEPVVGPVWVGAINLAGDRQADMVRHGGPDRAVLSYCAEHYHLWRDELGRPELAYGDFGENLTITGMSETNVCIGDVYEIGDAIIQMSEPRNPCWKLARRFKLKDMAVRVQRADRSGWYSRVLREGTVEAGAAVRLLERPHPEWTVVRCLNARHRQKDDLAEAAALAELPELGESWRDIMSKRVAPNDERRFWGPRPGDDDYAE